MDILESLNEHQRLAVMTTEGFLRVVAGAGSGKTKMLVSRYAYLATAAGIDGSSILCVTFTNKAANEMRRRVKRLIGEGVETPLIKTYHGFCAHLLRHDIEKIKYPKNFRILDMSDQKDIIKEIYESLELKLDFASFQKIQKEISLYKSDVGYVNYFLDSSPEPPPPFPKDPTVASVVKLYLAKQKAVFAMDFDDLMCFALYLLTNDAEVREKWQGRLEYIMVDEFQDSSRRETTLLDILCGGHGNLMVVGDPDQNIYEWRGSKVELLVDFDKTHADTKTIFMSENYRSTPNILVCANTLIDRNKLRLKKDLYTKNAAGAVVIHRHASDDAEENAFIVEKIREAAGNGDKFSDVAVLYRSSFLSRRIEKCLVEARIPYEIYGAARFYQRMEVRDIIAYLQVIASEDDLALERIINIPRRRFGKAKLERLRALRDGGNVSILGGTERVGGPTLYSTLRDNLGDPVLKNSDAADFVALIEKYRACTLVLSDLVNAVLSESGYEQYMRDLGDMERFENLNEFKNIAHEFENSYGERVTLGGFLSELALMSAEPDADEESDRVKLMTIHAAKGLEFKTVFVAGMTEGIFPSGRTLEERRAEGLEEERRLCYVALTRARERLYLLDNGGTNENGQKNLPSRFLFEIGEEHYERVGVIPHELIISANNYIKEHSYGFASEIADSVGARVTHSIFGAGTVIKYDPMTRIYTVKFDTLSTERKINDGFLSFGGEVAEVTPAVAPVPVVLEKPMVEGKPAGLDKSGVSELPPKKAEPRVRRNVTLTDDSNETNLWKRSDVPHEGWTCVGVTDLGEPSGICGMCGYQIIRYVHHMVHPSYRPIGAGCECAGKMEGNAAAAREREREIKNRAARREKFTAREWKMSKNGNKYIKYKERLIVITRSGKAESFGFSIDREFDGGRYKTFEEAALAAFDKVEKGV